MKLLKKSAAPSLLTAFTVLSLQAVIAFADTPKPVEPKSEAVPTKMEAAPAKTETVPQTSPSDALAKVNGTPITRAEMDRATKILAAQNRMPQNMDPETKKQVESAALDQLISAELVYQAGLKLEIKDLDKQVADKAAQGKARFSSTAEYEAALKTNSITDKEVLDLIRKDVVIGNLLEKEIVSKISVSDADIKKFYEENQDKFKQPESYHASHILIGVKPEANPEEKLKAREKAESLRKRILAGEDFATLAKAESTCPSSEKGGDLGFFGKDEMVPAFESATAALKPGEISGVVETQFGYHIIKLVEKKEGGVVKLDAAKGEIENYLKRLKMQKAVSDYVAKLKISAKIEKPDK
jgi:peptidyl-prolyl cis-trans isomerase C